MFNDWLLDELKQRDWSQADLARASGLTRAAISRYVSGYGRNPEPEALQKIAKALELPAEDVFRAAGILKGRNDDAWADEIKYKASQLTGIRRQLAERFLNTLLDEQDREAPSISPKTKPAKP